MTESTTGEVSGSRLQLVQLPHIVRWWIDDLVHFCVATIERDCAPGQRFFLTLCRSLG